MLVLGAAGGVGVAAVQISKVLGAKVVAVARGESKAKLLKNLGADAVIDTSADHQVRHVAGYFSVTGHECNTDCHKFTVIKPRLECFHKDVTVLPCLARMISPVGWLKLVNCLFFLPSSSSSSSVPRLEHYLPSTVTKSTCHAAPVRCMFSPAL